MTTPKNDFEDKKVIDTKLSLPWILTTAGTLLAAFLTFTYARADRDSKIEAKVDQVLQSMSEMKQRLDGTDQRYSDMLREMYEQKRVNDIQSLRIESLEKRGGGAK